MVILSFVIYLALLLAIGYFAYRCTDSFSGYLIGDRRVGALPAALSAGASDMSGWLLLVLPGIAMMNGYSSFWIAGALLLGTWLNWLLIAPRLRVYSQEAGDSLTLPAYFENRFGDSSGVLRTVSALIILLFSLFYLCAGMIAAGLLLETAFGINFSLAVLLCGLAVLCYTQLGGFLAVSWSDVLQSLIMLFTLILVPWLLIDAMGGIDLSLAQVSSRNPDLLNAMTDAEGKALTFMSLLGTLGLGLGYFGQPHILTRFLAIRSQTSVSVARRIAVIWTGFCLAGACLIGIAAIGYLPARPEQSDTVFLIVTQALLNPVVAGSLVIAVLAAIMSTVDSQLLTSASTVSEDLYRALFNRSASQTLLIKAGRRSVLALALIAMILAMDSESLILEWVGYAWAGLGAAFGPVLIGSLYWKRMNLFGALAGMLSGAVTVIYWKQNSGTMFELYELFPGIAAATVGIVVVSLITPSPDSALQRLFEKVQAKVK